MPAEIRTEITALRRAILSMGASVESRVGQAIDAFLNHDADLARSVRVRDHEIDEMEIDVEAECVRLLALCHPVAGDLRLVLAVLRINTDLERIGDLAKGIAKRTIDMCDAKPVALPESMSVMARTAREMVSGSLKALADEDAALCRHVIGSDQIVDDIQKEVFAWAIEEIPRHTDWTRAAIDVISVARALERIADHASNIAEDVIYLAEGAVVRHGADAAPRKPGH